MDDNKNLDSKIILEELFEHARGIGFAHRHAKIFDYILWEWQQRRRLGSVEEAEAILIDQAIDAVDECLEAMLQESDPRVRESIASLFEIMRKQENSD